MKTRTWLKRGLLVIVLLGLLIGSGSIYYRLSGPDFMQTTLRIAAVQGLSLIYSQDARLAQEIRSGYWIGNRPESLAAVRQSWKGKASQEPGFALKGSDFPAVQAPAFVYAAPDKPYLQELRSEFKLPELVSKAENEYQAMLELGSWLGTRWDHGTDRIDGNKQEMDPAQIILDGQSGDKYWCEIAAIVGVQTFTAMGWPARLVSTSKNGYDLHHGVAEVWSNQFGKWFVLDTDFNVVFESGGVPLSAYELCHQGPELQEKGLLQVRRFAPAKPSLKYKDLIPFFRYVQVDLRNDWHSRELRRGSPAGGDLATWWTARDSLGPVLTAKERVQDKKAFNWKVNSTWMELGEPRKGQDGYKLRLELSGYSPYFDHFQIRVDDAPWKNVHQFSHTVTMPAGSHSLQARMVTDMGHKGPVSSVDLAVMR